MVQLIKELICKWYGHTWVVVKRENIDYNMIVRLREINVREIER